MTLELDLDRTERAYVEAEVARLRATDPAMTIDTFLARMMKKLVGKWVADQRTQQLEVVQTAFLTLPHAARDIALETFRSKVVELHEQRLESPPAEAGAPGRVSGGGR